jgi:hypothetical protein
MNNDSKKKMKNDPSNVLHLGWRTISSRLCRHFKCFMDKNHKNVTLHDIISIAPISLGVHDYVCDDLMQYVSIRKIDMMLMIDFYLQSKIKWLPIFKNAPAEAFQPEMFMNVIMFFSRARCGLCLFMNDLVHRIVQMTFCDEQRHSLFQLYFHY